MNARNFTLKEFVSSCLPIVLALFLVFSSTVWHSVSHASTTDIRSASEDLGLPSGTIYGTISVYDSGPNSVGFSVDMDKSLFGGSIGINRFYLNTDLVLSSGDFSLPSNWSAAFKGYQVGSFGSFDIELSTTNGINGSLNPLNFTVTNSSITGIDNFSILSSTTGSNPPRLFAVHAGSFGTYLNGNDSATFSVPDANIMLLLGPAIIVLGILGRRRTKV